MKINVAQAMVILLVAFAILAGVSQAVATVDTSAYPSWVQSFFVGLRYVLLTSSIAPLFVMIRNIYGYFTNKAVDPTLQYEGKKMLATWLTYEGYIKGIAVFALALTSGTSLAQYGIWISGSAAFMVDLIRKSLSDISSARSTVPEPILQVVVTYGPWTKGEDADGEPLWQRVVFTDGVQQSGLLGWQYSVTDPLLKITPPVV